MVMKKFLKKTIIYAFGCIVFCVAFPYLLDPYNVFHWDNIRNNGVEPNKNYVKMRYVLDNPDKYDSFFFGSSRAGAVHTDKIAGEKCYNMTYSLGTVKEHLDNVRTFISEGIVPKHVYILVDSNSYTVNGEKHNSQPLRMTYEYASANKAEFYKTYLSAAMAFKSLRYILAQAGTDGYEYFYDYGWWCDYDRTSEIDWDGPLAPEIGDTDNIDERIKKCVNDVALLKALCEEYGIEFTVITTPMHPVTYRASVEEAEYLTFIKELSKVTEYINFSGLSTLTRDNGYYIDTSHFNAYMGDIMISVLEGETSEYEYEGFGYHVTKDNADELVEILKRQL